MTIVFTKHARLRMAQRDINEAEVINAIEKPDEVISIGSKRIFRKTFTERNKTLEVVGRVEGKNIVVITVYW
ncbi:MAG: DUF4258 domain-containing protein [Methanosarcinales archaeon]